MSERVAVLIPARKNATRLPNKLLLAESGQPLIVHTCQQAAAAFGSDQVVVCADHEDLVQVVEEAGFTAQLTRTDHESGTDRIAEVAENRSEEIYVNVQGDEPEINPAHIRLVAELLMAHEWAGMATLCTPGNAADQLNSHVVKVAMGEGGRALNFTRAPCPWNRDLVAPAEKCWRHIGIYAYRRDILLNYNNLPASQLENLERLEQLRALSAGIGMACAAVEEAAPGIDVREDYDNFLQRQKSGSA